MAETREFELVTLLKREHVRKVYKETKDGTSRSPREYVYVIDARHLPMAVGDTMTATLKSGEILTWVVTTEYKDKKFMAFPEREPVETLKQPVTIEELAEDYDFA